MKVNEEGKDKYGHYCLIFSGTQIVQKIHEWLAMRYGGGYKFCIVMDCIGEEFPEPGDVYVYFMDEIVDEVMQYSGYEKTDKSTYKRR